MKMIGYVMAGFVVTIIMGFFEIGRLVIAKTMHVVASIVEGE